jgi:hypothetical protein
MLGFNLLLIAMFAVMVTKQLSLQAKRIKNEVSGRA